MQFVEYALIATLWLQIFYKKPPVESATLSVLVFSFFQDFDWMIIDTLRDTVKLYNKSGNLSKQILVFPQNSFFKSW